MCGEVDTHAGPGPPTPTNVESACQKESIPVWDTSWADVSVHPVSTAMAYAFLLIKSHALK